MFDVYSMGPINRGHEESYKPAKVGTDPLREPNTNKAAMDQSGDARPHESMISWTDLQDFGCPGTEDEVERSYVALEFSVKWGRRALLRATGIVGPVLFAQMGMLAIFGHVYEFVLSFLAVVLDGLYGLQYLKFQVLQVNYTYWMHFDAITIIFHEVCWAVQEIRVGETLRWLKNLHTPGRTITSENWESYIQQFQYYCLQNLVGKLRFAIFDLPFFLLVVRNGLKGFDVPVDDFFRDSLAGPSGYSVQRNNEVAGHTMSYWGFLSACTIPGTMLHGPKCSSS
ncbi:hypothetical protein B0H14DRAFT_2586340 [Mycena olivaceomarginata]|nr:hypothetical protein B0H14DRAFT_2586340 [Mycena olivaceomarginata]